MANCAIWDASALSGWRKSSFSGNNGGSCVEVIDRHPSGVPVRDSVNPDGPAIVVSRAAWAGLIAAVKADELS